MSYSPVRLISTLQADRLRAGVYHSMAEAAAALAASVAESVGRLIAERKRAIGLFTASESQNRFLDALARDRDINWTRFIVLQLEETLGAAKTSIQQQLLDHLIKKVPIAEFHGIRCDAANPTAVCANYAETLRTRPPDFASLDLGPDGRLAAITPAICDFEDPAEVRIVDFQNQRAVTLTIPTILCCPSIFVLATGEEKARAVQELLTGDPSPAFPASILRNHFHCRLFVDEAAAAFVS